LDTEKADDENHPEHGVIIDEAEPGYTPPMTHVPLTSRLASLIGLPSDTSPKYDGTDDYYIPYTGTYAAPPPPPSTSQHTHTTIHTHAHTISGSTNKPSSTYSVGSNPHPYHPDRFIFLPPTSSTQTTMVEASERGRR